ncbi:MAG: hypothetical protein SPF56_10090 [Bacteroidaceae bacterium]|nr:hypothetical protein [Prevotellaceae bacterium]MDY5632818.1 hypothetical protein [Bacteroidaceae bacterium]
MPAPKIDFSDREERLQYVLERYKCMAPRCGHCGSCGMPDELRPEEVFDDYIEGKVEFVTIASKLYDT